MAKLISKTYGEALFELAVEENKIDIFAEEIQIVLQVLEENKEFLALMTHPKILKEEKLQIIQTVFENKISKELSGFFRLILEKDRFGKVKEIINYFLDEVKRIKGIGVISVITPIPLTDGQKRKIEDRLLETTSYKTLEANYSIDECLIGGVVIRIGDRVVDSSIRTKLEELTKQLMKIQLA